ncbi:2-oxoglutarate dehydrogenase, E2 component, dihydrolipoamide succinyltransferase, partial [human gut metagenome]
VLFRSFKQGILLADGNEVIAIRSVCYLAISYDHRLVDGADASRYLMTVKKRLEEGDFAGDLGPARWLPRD